MASRTFFVVALVCGLFVLAHGDRAQGAVHCNTFPDASSPTGYKRVCDGTSDGEGLYEFDCRSGTCNVCGNCHADKGGARPTEGSAEAHISKYEYSMKPGERIPWGRGVYVTVVDGRKCLMNDSKKIHCYPPGAIVVKGKGDAPVAILTPAAAARSTAPGAPKPALPNPSVPRKVTPKP
jgi:hypothetical protein